MIFKPTLSTDNIESILKQLPPSNAELRLLDVSPKPIVHFMQKKRPDILPIRSIFTNNSIEAEDNSLDAIVGHNYLSTLEKPTIFLSETWRTLRSGGRLILLDDDPKKSLFGKSRQKVTALETIADTLTEHGFARLLIEKLPSAILSRGEKPYSIEKNTLERIANSIDDKVNSRVFYGEDLRKIKGKFIHILIRQTPNKPVWENNNAPIYWEGVAIHPNNARDEQIVLGFSSLPQAVQFMQQAVLENVLSGINKIGKFKKSIAAEWSFPIWLNPSTSNIQQGYDIRFIPINPKTAEAPDE